MMKIKPEDESDTLLSVSLLLRGEYLDLGSITDTLGCSPDKSFVKGDIKKLSSGTTVTRRNSFWGIYEKRESGDIFDALSALLSRITASDNLFSIVHGLQEAEVSIFVAKDFERNDSAHIRFSFPENYLNRLAALGVVLSFDVAFVEE